MSHKQSLDFLRELDLRLFLIIEYLMILKAVERIANRG